MAQIQTVTYPHNIGSANDLRVTIKINSEEDGGKIVYFLKNTSTTPPASMGYGFIDLTEAQVQASGSDSAWALSHAATQLGVTLV